MPTAVATSCCSAIHISKKRSGCALANSSAWVELDTSPSMATTSGMAPSASSASPYALRVATFSSFLYVGKTGSGLAGRRAAGAPRSGFCVLTLRFLIPPSSLIARSAMSGGSGLPCQPSLFSISENPLPLTVLAMMMVGLSVFESASPNALSTEARSCPSITIG